MAGSDDNFVSFGTALEPIEEEEVARKKPITVAEQIATDENGRRRFHGAFTGGFSAGYWNTVGSKEGWTPTTFKSSRSERATSSASTGARGQNVTDFMDEEDMGAFGIAPQVLRQTEEFSMSEAQSASRKRPKAPQSEGPIPGMPVLHQIIIPAKETVGIKILIKMGWRPGQGVGPRISKTKKDKSTKSKDKAKDQEIEKPSIVDLETDVDMEKLVSQKVYGCQLPAEFKKPAESSEESDLEEDVLYAPEDVESPLCNPKENSFGLGYKGLERMSAGMGAHIDLFGTPLKFSSTSSGGRVMDSKKMGKGSSAVNVTGEAFGIGAFEEPDEDVYNREDMSSYDFELETGEERRARKTQEMLDKLKKKTSKDSCIQGFHFAKDVTVKKKFFPPPVLPPNFQPRHKQRKSRFEKPAEPKPEENSSNSSNKRGLGRHALSVQERQVLLGETPAPLIPSQETEAKIPPPEPAAEQDAGIQERVERIKKFVQVLQASSSGGVATESTVSKPVFQPFLKNPEKQERYEKYLTLVSAGFQDSLKDLQPPQMLEWEKERERAEFERARDIYKPLSGVMSSRFVTAKSHDISHIVPEKEAVIEKDPSEDPKVAAKLNLFGRLTHSVVEWHPDKVLCKRFNMKDPYPESKFVGLLGTAFPSKNISKTNIVAEVQDAVAASIPQPLKKSLFDNLDFSKPPPGLPGLGLEAMQTTSSSSVEESSSLEFQSSIAEKENAAPVKAPLDLFKQIFADSSEEEEEEETEKGAIIPTLTNSRNASKDNSDNPSPPKDNRTVPDEKTSQKDKRPGEDRAERKILYEKRYSREEQESRRGRDRDGRDRSSGNGGRGIFDNLDLSRLSRRQPENEDLDKSNIKERKEMRQEDVEENGEDVYGPKAPIIFKPRTTAPTTTSRQSQSSSTFTSFTAKQSLTSSEKESIAPSRGREEEKEEVVWVEKDAKSSDSHKKKKDKKRSSSKGSKKSKKAKSKEKHKKSKKHKSNKKSSKRQTNSDSEDSESSSSSVEIRGSLNQRALLAQLKEITGSR